MTTSGSHDLEVFINDSFWGINDKIKINGRIYRIVSIWGTRQSASIVADGSIAGGMDTVLLRDRNRNTIKMQIIPKPSK